MGKDLKAELRTNPDILIKNDFKKSSRNLTNQIFKKILVISKKKYK